MLFKNLVEMVHAVDFVKVYMVDHVHPGLLTGYVLDPRKKRVESGREVSYIDLQPYVALLSLNPNESLMGYPANDPAYHGLLFQGRYVTTDFDKHKMQVEEIINQIIKSGGESPKKLEEYFKWAKKI